MFQLSDPDIWNRGQLISPTFTGRQASRPPGVLCDREGVVVVLSRSAKKNNLEINFRGY